MYEVLDGLRFRTVNGQSETQRILVQPPIALYKVQLIAVGMPGRIEPRLRALVGRVWSAHRCIPYGCR